MTHPVVDEPALRDQADRLLWGHPYVDADPDAVIEILRKCATRTIAPGEVLCSEGEPGDELFILLTGVVEVTKTDLDGHVSTIGEVAAPSLLGQMAIVDRSRRTATCTATVETLVATMDLATFTSLVRGTAPPGVALRRLLLSSLTRQLVEGNARLRGLMERAETAGRESLSDELFRATGVLDGWMAIEDARRAPRSRGTTPTAGPKPNQG